MFFKLRDKISRYYVACAEKKRAEAIEGLRLIYPSLDIGKLARDMDMDEAQVRNILDSCLQKA